MEQHGSPLSQQLSEDGRRLQIVELNDSDSVSQQSTLTSRTLRRVSAPLKEAWRVMVDRRTRTNQCLCTSMR